MSEYDKQFREQNSGQHRRAKAAATGLPVDGEENAVEVGAPEFLDVSNWDSWAEFGDGESEVEITVHRAATSHRGKEAFCMRFYSSSYSPLELLEAIQEKHGGGEYRVRGFINKKAVFNRPIVIEGKPISETAPAVRNDGALDARAFQSQLLEQQIHGQRQMLELMQSITSSLRPAQQPNAIESMQGMFALMTAARDLFKPAESQQNPLELIQKGIEFAREYAGGGGDGESSTNDVLLQLLQTVSPVLQKIVERPVIQQVRANPSPAAPVVKAPQVQGVPGQRVAAGGENKPVFAPVPKKNVPPKFQQFAPVLVSALLSSDSVHDTAQTVLDATNLLSDDDFDIVADFVFESDAVGKLARMAPELGQRREFIAEVVELLREVWGEPEPGGEDAEGQGTPAGLAAVELTPPPVVAIKSPEPKPKNGKKGNKAAKVNDSSGILPVTS